MRNGSTSALGREKIRLLNQSAIINAIHRSRKISRTDLAAQLRLSPAAVTNLTASLIDTGLVVEVEVGESQSVGRKPILLGINYDHSYVVGAKVMPDAIVASLTNLNADVLGTVRVPLADSAVGTVAAAVVASKAELCDKLGVPGHRVAGLGVSLPGVVDYLTGIVKHSDLLGWHDVRLAEELRDVAGLSAVVENDVNALAAAQSWFGLGRAHDSFLTVTMGRGVGLGIVIGGAIYRGPRGGAGEVGHTRCTPIGPRVMRPGTTTLEERLGDAALLAEAHRAVAGFPRDARPEALTALAARGDETALGLLADAGECLGVALSDLVNLFAPTLVILGGEGLRNSKYFLPQVRPALERHAFGGLADGLELIVDSWGDDAWARGAAGLAAARFLEAATEPLSALQTGPGLTR
ncbi:MAG: ROK family transcriptional regulator [Trueperaceae bacterium]|nr:ROK family transcriptional regulator [Trueperaceae bacterium]